MSMIESPTSVEFPWETYPDFNSIDADSESPYVTYTYVVPRVSKANRLLKLIERFASFQSAETYVWACLLPDGFAISLCIHDDRGISSHEALTKLLDPPMTVGFAITNRQSRRRTISKLRAYASPSIESDICSRYPSIDDYKRVRSSADVLLLANHEFNTKSRFSVQEFATNVFGHHIPFVLNDDTLGTEVISERQSFSFDDLAPDEIAPVYEPEDGVSLD